MTKKCTKCSEEKSIDEFFKDKANLTDGRYSICKKCKQDSTYKWREKNKDKYNELAKKWRKNNPNNLYGSEIKRRYGCDLDTYNALLAAQDFKCKICDYKHNTIQKRARLYVDHCHNSKKIRGLLCHRCNCMLGYARDQIDILKKAVVYLESE